MTQEEFLSLLSVYIDKEFYQFSEYTALIENLVLPLQKLILCDRYNKGEPVTDNIDFEVVRNVLHKFNTRHLLEFFGQKEFAFLYKFYFEKQGIKDAQQQTDVDTEKLVDELKALYDEASTYVPESDNSFYQ